MLSGRSGAVALATVAVLVSAGVSATVSGPAAAVTGPQPPVSSSPGMRVAGAADALAANRPQALRAGPDGGFDRQPVQSSTGWRYMPHGRTNRDLPVGGGDLWVLSRRPAHPTDSRRVTGEVIDRQTAACHLGRADRVLRLVAVAVAVAVATAHTTALVMASSSAIAPTQAVAMSVSRKDGPASGTLPPTPRPRAPDPTPGPTPDPQPGAPPQAPMPDQGTGSTDGDGAKVPELFDIPGRVLEALHRWLAGLADSVRTFQPESQALPACLALPGR